MKLKKIFLIFIALVVFSPILTAESDYDYFMEKYGLIKKRIAEEIEQSIFVKIPDRNYSIMATEVTQKLYEAVMGENPSEHKGDELPVENVSWFDCVVFCNKLSENQKLKPCYSYKGSTDVSEWEEFKEKDFVCNFNASGYRLPTLDEWRYAARGGEDYKYAGSDNLDAVGWYRDNSDKRTHPVAQKKPNGYGLYDMSGNVREWVWDSRGRYDDNRYYCGGSYSRDDYCEVDYRDFNYAYYRYYNLGFRLVCPSE